MLVAPCHTSLIAAQGMVTFCLVMEDVGQHLAAAISARMHCTTQATSAEHACCTLLRAATAAIL